jgi:hypothetical protein
MRQKWRRFRRCVYTLFEDEQTNFERRAAPRVRILSKNKVSQIELAHAVEMEQMRAMRVYVV